MICTPESFFGLFSITFAPASPSMLIPSSDLDLKPNSDILTMQWLFESHNSMYCSISKPQSVFCFEIILQSRFQIFFDSLSQLNSGNE